MTDAQIIALVMGTIAPGAIAVIVRQGWSYAVRHAVALGVYLLLSLAVWAFQQTTSPDWADWRGLVRVFAPMAIAGNAAFAIVWKQTGVVDKIEKAT